MTLDSIIILEADDTTQQEQIVENIKLLISKNKDSIQVITSRFACYSGASKIVLVTKKAKANSKLIY